MCRAEEIPRRPAAYQARSIEKDVFAFHGWVPDVEVAVSQAPPWAELQRDTSTYLRTIPLKLMNRSRTIYLSLSVCSPVCLSACLSLPLSIYLLTHLSVSYWEVDGTRTEDLQAGKRAAGSLAARAAG